ncbi:MAG: ubiquitin-like small modifier protein 1 [Chloroflexota bacterium]
MKINFYATLRPIVGGRSITLDLEEQVTVSQLVAAVVERYPPLREQLLDEQDQLFPHVHVFINGRDAPYLPDGLEALVTTRDTVDIFPATAGG